tara:strand:- start:2146 stop:2367 length:222 start_codon:yes stop_codon:yes gene_type:complete
MEKQNNPHVHEKNNVIAFPTQLKKKKTTTSVEVEIDVVLCSVCESQSFFLLSNTYGICCNTCGNVMNLYWTTP